MSLAAEGRFGPTVHPQRPPSFAFSRSTGGLRGRGCFLSGALEQLRTLEVVELRAHFRLGAGCWWRLALEALSGRCRLLRATCRLLRATYAGERRPAPAGLPRLGRPGAAHADAGNFAGAVRAALGRGGTTSTSRSTGPWRCWLLRRLAPLGLHGGLAAAAELRRTQPCVNGTGASKNCADSCAHVSPRSFR